MFVRNQNKVLAGACLLTFGLAGCAGGAVEAPPGVLVVSQEQQASWIRNFNPLLSTGGARWPTSAGIYEPLMIYNSVQGEWVPWLATGYAWDDETSLRFAIREGVAWSDGQPFTAADVGFTFELLREHKALDAGGIWQFLSSVEVAPAEEGADEAGSAEQIVFRFARPYSPGLARLAHQPIVPAHVWGALDDPVAFANPDPVGTGPFTEVLRFDPQIWELGRNPGYWQGAPAVEALRFPALPTNDQANLALLNGEVDWAGNFVPAIDRIFVGRDPEHHRYWFPVVGGTVFLYANTARPPFDDPRLRQAISHAIDRELVVKIAMYDYAPPTHPTGLSDGYAEWRRDDLAGWVDFDPARAGALLDDAGFPLGDDGLRRGADGQPLTVEVNTVAGWSDWIRAAQVITRNLQDVGVDAHLKSHDFSAWFERLGRGDFDLSLSWSQEGATPYDLYKGLMSSDAVVPLGEVAATNWHRFGSPRADALLAAFERTGDRAEQRALADELQAAFIEEIPAIPLFPSPSWGECNTRRFTGFPSPEDPYARLSPNYPPETLLVMTRLAPREPTAGGSP